MPDKPARLKITVTLVMSDTKARISTSVIIINYLINHVKYTVAVGGGGGDLAYTLLYAYAFIANA